MKFEVKFKVGAEKPPLSKGGGAAAPDEGEVRLIARFYNSHVSFALISPLRGQLPPLGEAFSLRSILQSCANFGTLLQEHF